MRKLSNMEVQVVGGGETPIVVISATRQQVEDAKREYEEMRQALEMLGGLAGAAAGLLTGGACALIAPVATSGCYIAGGVVGGLVTTKVNGALQQQLDNRF